MLANGCIRLPTNASICLCANGCECLHTNGQIEFLWQKSGIISGAFGFALFYFFVCKQTLSSVCVQTAFGVCWQTDLSLIGKSKCPRFCLLWQTDRLWKVLFLANASHCLCCCLTKGLVSFCGLHGLPFLSLHYPDGNYICGHTRMAVESADTPFAA